MERKQAPRHADADSRRELPQTRARRPPLGRDIGVPAAGSEPVGATGAISFPAGTRIRPMRSTVIQRFIDGDDDDYDDDDDGFIEGEWDDFEPRTRAAGTKERSKHQERRSNWNARGAERSRDKRKQERRRARDRKYPPERPVPWKSVQADKREQEERERAEQERRAREEKERKEAAEREQQERERQEREQQDRERQERERQERERQEAEERKRQDADRLRRDEEERRRKAAEVELRAEQDSLLHWSEAVDDTELFKARARRHLARLRASLPSVPDAKQQFVKLSLDKASSAIEKAKAQRTQKEAIDELRTAAKRLADATVDTVGPLRTAARARVGQAKTDAEQLLAAHRQAGPGHDLAESLVADAREIKSNADADSMMGTPTDIAKVAAAAAELIRAVTTARDDIALFHLVTGSYKDCQHQLEQLRGAGLSVQEMSTLMSLVPAAGGTKRGEQLVNLCKVAREPNAIGLVGLAQVLATQGVDADHLVHVIVLAKVMNLPVQHITGHLLVMQEVASKFPLPFLKWFDGFAWAHVTSLVAACDSTRLATFSTKVRGTKILRLLTDPTRALTAAQLLQYEANPEILDGFDGMTDGGWGHVVRDTHYDPSLNTISGGHNESSFDIICANPADGVTCTRRLLRSAQGRVVKKYEYTLTKGGSSKTSSKTVITGLKTNEQAWRQSAELATWDALRQGRFSADGGWSGQDGATWWAGKHKGGFVTTAYPDI